VRRFSGPAPSGAKLPRKGTATPPRRTSGLGEGRITFVVITFAACWMFSQNASALPFGTSPIQKVYRLQPSVSWTDGQTTGVIEIFPSGTGRKALDQRTVGHGRGRGRSQSSRLTVDTTLPADR